MNVTISMDKRYRTRDGRDVRILCTNRDHVFNVVGMVGTDIMVWNKFGRHSIIDEDYNLDLIEFKPKTRWLIIYSDNTATLCPFNPFRVGIDVVGIAKNRIACIRVEYEEGEGL